MKLADFGVVGIEPDAAACRAAMSGDIRVVHGSAEAIPAELATMWFDVVTMTHVLEHTLEPLKAIENVAELLVPGGTLFVETPNNACRGAREAGMARGSLDVPRHLNFFTPSSLRAICERAGLEVVGVDYTG